MFFLLEPYLDFDGLSLLKYAYPTFFILKSDKIKEFKLIAVNSFDEVSLKLKSKK